MSPDELHQELIEAVKAWRDDERAGTTDQNLSVPEGYRVVWLDTGSGPGARVIVPTGD